MKGDLEKDYDEKCVKIENQYSSESAQSEPGPVAEDDNRNDENQQETSKQPEEIQTGDNKPTKPAENGTTQNEASDAEQQVNGGTE